MENLGKEMKSVLIIGNLGYIGPVAVKYLKEKNPDLSVSGYDIGFFMQNYTNYGMIGETYLTQQFFGDVRKFDEKILKGFDAVIYLAAISNDPMGNVYEKPTLDINYHAAIDIAKKSKKQGVRNFVFASSCSVYGFADSAPRTETSEVNPLTAYAKSKVYAERDLEPLADSDFKVTCLRYATACGFSDRLRLDLVLNDFVASAIVDKKITILSDGTPWRPLIHVRDMSRAMDWGRQRNEGDNFIVVNAGSNSWNYQVKELAYAVQKAFNGIEININANAQPDKRSYKVSFDLFSKIAPGFQPEVSLDMAIADLKKGLEAIQFSDSNFRQSHLIRLKTIQKLINDSVIDSDLVKIERKAVHIS
ncbi:MAG: NAD-dependent epimerase/dehydratase family protein [Bacteroidia bacterium]